MVQMAEEALKTWRELIALKDPRLVIEALQFMQVCVAVLTQNGGYGMALNLETKPKGDAELGQQTTRGRFVTVQDMRDYINLLLETKTKNYEHKYF
jgi:hypothetical protein